MNKKTGPIILIVVIFLLAFMASAWGHCEIPCGIYDDDARFDMLEEHITTIEKSMDEITRLSAEGDKNYNQLVRWVVNKENHAEKFIAIVSQYFITQRIAPVAPDQGQKFTDYQKSLTLTHQLIHYAMKTKQTVDKANTTKLRELVSQYREHYFKDHGHTP